MMRALEGYMTNLSEAVRAAEDQGRCFDAPMREIKLPKYEKLGSCEQYLAGNVQRFCEYLGPRLPG